MSLVKRLAEHSLFLVFLCTVTGAAAQILFKLATQKVPDITVGMLLRKPWMIVAVPQMFFGYALYGMNVVLLTLALRKGELSLLYPVISLTYVWVAILSVIFFHEQVNLFEGLGLCTIVIGVGVLGADKRLGAARVK